MFDLQRFAGVYSNNATDYTGPCWLMSGGNTLAFLVKDGLKKADVDAAKATIPSYSPNDNNFLGTYSDDIYDAKIQQGAGAYNYNYPVSIVGGDDREATIKAYWRGGTAIDF